MGSLCTPIVAHHPVHRPLHILLVAPTNLRAGKAPKGSLAASTYRANIAHQMAERVVDGTISNGAPSPTMQIPKAVLLWMLAADVVVAMMAHHLFHRPLLLVAPTNLRTGKAPKGSLAASTYRTNIAHQMVERV